MASTVAGVVAAPPEQVPPPAKHKSKRRKKKGKTPPYKTYEVVTLTSAGGPPTVMRMVNDFDVLVVDSNTKAASTCSSDGELYDYSRQPGNQRYRKFVDLSQLHFETMSHQRKANGNMSVDDDNDSEEGKQQALAQMVAKTIREKWGGMFLRRLEPDNINCTKWVEVGIRETVEYVLQQFKQNAQKKKEQEQEQNHSLKVEEGQHAAAATNLLESTPREEPQEQPTPREEPQQQQPQQQPEVQQVPTQESLPIATDQQYETPASPIVAEATVQTPGSDCAGIGIIQEPHARQAILEAHSAFTPMGKAAGKIEATSPMPSLTQTDTAPPLSASPGMAFARQIQLPATPAMPPLIEFDPSRHPTTPMFPELPALPGVANPIVPPVDSVPANHNEPQQTVPLPGTTTATNEGPVKRKRGRPRKGEERPPKPSKRPRGRPRKNALPEPPPIPGDCDKERRGRHRLVPLPDPRQAHTMAPLMLSLDPLESKAGGHNRDAFVLSPATARKDYDFGMEASPNFDFPETPRPKQGTITYLSPPRPSTPLPFPSPTKAIQVDSHIDQAKAYLKFKDPIWLSFYTKLASCRITMYCHGHMDKWVAGNVRHTYKKTSLRGDDTPLNAWAAEQQAMYRDYCAWEESKHFGQQQEQLAANHHHHHQQQQQQQQSQPTLQHRQGTHENEASREPLPQLSNVPTKIQTAPVTMTQVAPPENPPAPATLQPASSQEVSEPKEPAATGSNKKDETSGSVGNEENNGATKRTSLRSRVDRKRTKQRLPRISKKGKQEPNADAAGAVENSYVKVTVETETTVATAESKAQLAKVSDGEGQAQAHPPPSKTSEPVMVVDVTGSSDDDEHELAGLGPSKKLQQQANATSTMEHVSGDANHVDDSAETSSNQQYTSVFPELGDAATSRTTADVPDGVAAINKPNGEVQLESAIKEEDRKALESRNRKLREIQRAKILLLDDIHFAWQPDQEPPVDAPEEWKSYFYELREYLRSRGDTAVSDTVELGAWAQLQRIQFQRSMAIMTNKPADGTTTLGISQRSTSQSDPPLSRGQMAALRGLGFDFDDLESSQFYLMYLKLIEFKSRVGDCLVPPPSNEFLHEERDECEDDEVIVATRADPKLYFWVQRQRYEYIRFLRAKEIAAQQASGVDEDGHALVLKLLEEEEEKAEELASNSQRDDAFEDNDNATVVVDLVRSPARKSKGGDGERGEGGAQHGCQDGAPHATRTKENEEHCPGRKRKKYAKTTKDPLGRAKATANPSVLKSSDGVSTLTQTQIDLLNAAGFIWSNDISFSWILQYRRLHAFFIKNGHSKVTKATNEAKTKLNRWCTNLRQLYQRNRQGKKFGLSQDKYDLLKKLDFQFEIEDLPERFAFDERYKWLVEYKEQHGHVNVPQRHPTLGHFVKRLRKEYEGHKKGGKFMNPEKIRKLNEIGFSWRVRNHRGFRSRTMPQADGESEKDEDDDDDEDSDEDLLPQHGNNHRVLPLSKYKGSDVPENRCFMCYGEIIYPSARCGSCRGGYCKDCFDEIVTGNDEKCSCNGTVLPTSWGGL